MTSSAGTPEKHTLVEAFGLSVKYLPFLAPLIVFLATVFSGLAWSLLGSFGGETAALPFFSRALEFGLLAVLGLFRLIVSFILTSIALRQLTRSDHLGLSRLGRALESDLWPMMVFGVYIFKRRSYLLLLFIFPTLLMGLMITPVGGVGLLFDLFSQTNAEMQFSDFALVLLSLAVFYYLLPYLFTGYQLLFHGGEPREAERLVRIYLIGHRQKIFGGLLLASLPYYLADQCLFNTDWHPVLRHAVGSVFAIPFITTAYLFYTRMEAGIQHSQA